MNMDKNHLISSANLGNLRYTQYRHSNGKTSFSKTKSTQQYTYPHVYTHSQQQTISNPNRGQATTTSTKETTENTSGSGAASRPQDFHHKLQNQVTSKLRKMYTRNPSTQGTQRKIDIIPTPKVKQELNRNHSSANNYNQSSSSYNQFSTSKKQDNPKQDTAQTISTSSNTYDKMTVNQTPTNQQTRNSLQGRPKTQSLLFSHQQSRQLLRPLHKDPTEVLFNPVGYYNRLLQENIDQKKKEQILDMRSSNIPPASTANGVRPQSSNVYSNKLKYKSSITMNGNLNLNKVNSLNGFDRPITSHTNNIPMNNYTYGLSRPSYGESTLNRPDNKTSSKNILYQRQDYQQQDQLNQNQFQHEKQNNFQIPRFIQHSRTSSHKLNQKSSSQIFSDLNEDMITNQKDQSKLEYPDNTNNCYNYQPRMSLNKQSTNDLNLHLDERPSTSQITANTRRGYNYFYNAKQQRHYTNNVEKIDRFMKDLDQKQKDREATDGPFSDTIKDFAFIKEFQEFQRSKLQWQFYDRQWGLYLQRSDIQNVNIELPLPPCKFGLFFFIKDKIYQEYIQKQENQQQNNNKEKSVPFLNQINNKKLMKKVKQEIMRRYHPDKHNQVINNDNQQSIESSNKLVEEINEICRIANIIYEATLKL
ncbi:UNKNOWN [Stylonychia lemnae]|uniref:Uncharacterized protein n=1 Tax=Stylonychia lemnae TaxID=5949 RepID=A0A078A4S4_STYLE|nr:UNKNOWN [Stylonychia lemnae]|eukprot:CDW75769.1 UNKNOWN [Stylonychia lemnae]